MKCSWRYGLPDQCELPEDQHPTAEELNARAEPPDSDGPNVNAIRARAEAAPVGPWWNESGVIHAPIPNRPGAAWHPMATTINPLATGGAYEDAIAAVEFAAHAREDIPYLLDHISWLESEVAHWMDATGDADQLRAESAAKEARIERLETALQEARMDLMKLCVPYAHEGALFEAIGRIEAALAGAGAQDQEGES